MDINRVGCENEVSELDAMVRHGVHKVEVEITQKVREVLLYDVDHAQSGVVKCLDCCWDCLPWNHVILQECQRGHYQLFDLVSFLEERSITAVCVQLS